MNDHDRIVRLEERQKADRQARKLQAVEYERRLEALNHENARILANAAIYLPREVFDGYVKEAAAREQRLAEAVSLARDEGSGQAKAVGVQQQRSQRVTGLVFAVIGAVGVLVAVVAVLVK